jgi:lipopolysaccharide cholinephosphotransferase
VAPGIKAGIKLSTDEIRQIELDLLDAFMAFCKEQGLTCWLAYGTLLGAARHGGFIPWDDDIDLLMPLEDYNAAIAILNADKEGAGALPSHYRFASIESNDNRNYHIWFAKIYDMRTSVRQTLLAEHVKVDEGCWIDVFPLLGVNSKDEWRRLQDQGYRYQSIVKQATFSPQPSHNPLKSFVRWARHQKARLQGYQNYLRSHQVMFNRQPSFRDTPYAMDCDDLRNLFTSANFLETTQMEFEGKRYPVPKGWDAFLTETYGDWRTLPPENERVSHAFEAYWR